MMASVQLETVLSPTSALLETEAGLLESVDFDRPRNERTTDERCDDLDNDYGLSPAPPRGSLDASACPAPFPPAHQRLFCGEALAAQHISTSVPFSFADLRSEPAVVGGKEALTTLILLRVDDAEEHDDPKLQSNFSSSSSAHSVSVDSLSSGESLSRLTSDDFGDVDSSYIMQDSRPIKASPNGTIYGKVVKSIQHSIRRIFHCGKTPPRSDESNFFAAADCFASVSQTVTLTATTAPHSTLFSATTNTIACPASMTSTGVDNHNLEVPLSAIQPAESPITSADPGDLPLFEMNKKLLVEFSDPTAPILAQPREEDQSKKCLVLDLDETLVHSTFQPTPNADLVVPVHLGQGVFQPIYVCKRPGVDEFLRHVVMHFEVVIFTASLSNYADPVIDFLDPKGYIRFRLYREACLQFQGMYIKDLSRLGRDLDQVLIIDNSPISYSMHRKNALACRSWFADPTDRELEERLLPVLLRLVDAPTVSQWRRENLDAIKTPYYK